MKNLGDITIDWKGWRLFSTVLNQQLGVSAVPATMSFQNNGKYNVLFWDGDSAPTAADLPQGNRLYVGMLISYQASTNPLYIGSMDGEGLVTVSDLT